MNQRFKIQISNRPEFRFKFQSEHLGFTIFLRVGFRIQIWIQGKWLGFKIQIWSSRALFSDGKHWKNAIIYCMYTFLNGIIGSTLLILIKIVNAEISASAAMVFACTCHIEESMGSGRLSFASWTIQIVLPVWPKNHFLLSSVGLRTFLLQNIVSWIVWALGKMKQHQEFGAWKCH